MAYKPGCFCDFDCVEKTYMGTGADVGRKYWACPLERRVCCGFSAWIDEPLEERAVDLIHELQRKINKLEIQNQCNKWTLMDSHKREMDVMKRKVIICVVLAAVLFNMWSNVDDDYDTE